MSQASSRQILAATSTCSYAHLHLHAYATHVCLQSAKRWHHPSHRNREEQQRLERRQLQPEIDSGGHPGPQRGREGRKCDCGCAVQQQRDLQRKDRVCTGQVQEEEGQEVLHLHHAQKTNSAFHLPGVWVLPPSFIRNNIYRSLLQPRYKQIDFLVKPSSQDVAIDKPGIPPPTGDRMVCLIMTLQRSSGTQPHLLTVYCHRMIQHKWIKLALQARSNRQTHASHTALLLPFLGPALVDVSRSAGASALNMI